MLLPVLVIRKEVTCIHQSPLHFFLPCWKNHLLICKKRRLGNTGLVVTLVWLWSSLFHGSANSMKFLLHPRHLLPSISHWHDWQVPPTKPTQDRTYVMSDKKKMFFSQKIHHAVLISWARNLSFPSLCIHEEKYQSSPFKFTSGLWKMSCMEIEVAI